MPDTLVGPVATRLKAMADPTRLRILNLLRQREWTVQDIASAIAASQPNVSRHLAILRRAGIVEFRHEGKHAWYRIVDPWIDRICEAVCGSVTAQARRQMELVGASSPPNDSPTQRRTS